MNCHTQCPWTCSRPPLTHASAGDLDTHRQVWVRLLRCHCSFLLRPDALKVLFVPSKGLFSQSCLSSGGSMVGLKATSSKRAYATPRSAAPRAPAPVAGHSSPIPPHSNIQRRVWLSLCEVSWCTQDFDWALQASLVGRGFDSKCNFALPAIFLGFLLCPWMWGIFFWCDPTFSFWWLFIASCNFGGK